MGPWYESSKSLCKFATMNKAHRCEHCWLGIFQVYFWRMLELQCLNCSTKGTLLSPAVHEMLLTVKPSISWARMYPRIFQGRGGRGVQTLMERAKKFFFYNFYTTSNRHSCFCKNFDVRWEINSATGLKQKVCTSLNLPLALPLLNIQLEHCDKLEMCFVDYDKYSIVLQRDRWTSFYCGIFGNQVCCESQRNSSCKKRRDEKERRNKESWEKKRKKK